MKRVTGTYSAPRPHWVGDGFPARSMFSYNTHGQHLSPFLLLDYAGPYNFAPSDTPRGVGQHPHRGFETVTIVYEGEVAHRDSTGAGGTIGPGDVQWMTAASGILHEEFHTPEFSKRGGTLDMVQLWVNLPAKEKMTDPKYQEFAPERIPVVHPEAGVDVKVIAGNVDGTQGPIVQPATDPLYLDITLAPDRAWTYALPEGHNAFAYVFEGAVTVGEQDAARDVARQELAVLGGGEQLHLSAGSEGARLILVAGRPLREPVMRHGPFVMNTRQELMQAFVDFQEGKF